MIKALACDYDGTLAADDRLGPSALAALHAARTAGLRLILVTGRTLFDLTRVCEHVDLFEGVVAENGGVLYFPAAAALHMLAPSPPRRFLAELDRRGVPYEVGRVVVATARSHDAEVRAALIAADVSLELVPNRAALMALPVGVSKGSGIRHMLRALGLSFHDVVALGDAENDLDLFDACGWSGCPASAVPEVLQRVDWVFPGNNGEAIATAIQGPITRGRLPLDRSLRQRLELGWAAGDAGVVTIPARGITVLLEGDPSSGKSWLAGSIVERLRDHQYAVCVVDPEGDYGALARLAGVVLVQAQDDTHVDAAFRQFLLDPAACVVIDLSPLSHAGKVAVVERILTAAREIRQRIGLPHWIVLDEAHYFLHRSAIANPALVGSDKGLCLVTYKPSWLRPVALDDIDVVILARSTEPAEVAFIQEFLLARKLDVREFAGTLAELSRGTFLLMRRASTGDWTAVRFTATPRTTPHVRHLGKYADTAVRPEHAFRFETPDGQCSITASSLDEFRRATATIEARVLGHHAERRDFSRWIRDIFSDAELAAQIAKAERRWVAGEITDLRQVIDALISARYWSEDR